MIWKHYGKWKQFVLYEVIYMKCSDRKILRQQTCGARDREGEMESDSRAVVSIGDNKNILELDNGDVYIIFEYISKHYIVYSKRMDVMVFKQKMLGKLVNT